MSIPERVTVSLQQVVAETLEHRVLRYPVTPTFNQGASIMDIHDVNDIALAVQETWENLGGVTVVTLVKEPASE